MNTERSSKNIFKYVIKQCCQKKLKLNTIDVLFSKALIDSYIGHDEFTLVYNVLREHNEMKKEMKNSETFVEQTT